MTVMSVRIESAHNARVHLLKSLPCICLQAILPLIAFWEQTRGLYAPFEADMRAGSTDVYLHEMPGGEVCLLQNSCMPGCLPVQQVAVSYTIELIVISLPLQASTRT